MLGMEEPRLREVICSRSLGGQRWVGIQMPSVVPPPPPTASRPSLNGPHGPTEEFHTITDVAMIPGLFFFPLAAPCFVGTVSEQGFSFVS